MNARRYLLFIYVTMLTKMRISDAIQMAFYFWVMNYKVSVAYIVSVSCSGRFYGQS